MLIQFLLDAAAANGVDFGSNFLLPYLQYVLGLSSTASQVTTSVNTAGESCAPTGTTARAQALILAAVQNLKTNLAIQSVVRLDEYQTPLNFNQYQVPTVLDRSVLYLTGIVGKTSTPFCTCLGAVELSLERSCLAHRRSSTAFVQFRQCLQRDQQWLHCRSRRIVDKRRA